MGSIIPFLTEGQLRFFLLSNRVIQWTSSVIVLGITSYFINTGPRGLTIVYLEVVAVVSVVVFLPAFVSPFLSTPVKDFVLFVDVIFSYLWLAGFIFAAVDYNQNNCHANAPPGVVCSVKWANEAFIFLTFIFTFFALFLETLALWLSRRSQNSPIPHHEKQDPRSSVHSGTRLQGENTIESTATPAQVV
ncbi:Membrane-associating domain protein [Aspergillus parasiticus SU-1]|uniref:MARVEL domain-containing protein n=4 Tax=Aspergillus subgen. Circumdati TaxID=2720871 RepID=A0A5N6DN87_ASPPA|nr:hypothetical protein BDV34DRAFT_224346 [Aspergillus parasiticus]KAE8317063.1 hypothetical protein BDV41DRAFT_573167 [Aspergillus transmontanensis]KAE8345544.1 hypothetical protein BDV24DRAFT_159407 [Aspergillus arachidicola]KJK67273.1 Membrane-associating domain protein [Aspergillus parasiticus SU-1]